MHIDTHFLALDNWSLPWTHVIAKLVIYSITLQFLIIPGIYRLHAFLREVD